jgi:uncharacterized protein (TIGR02118 family)
MVRLLVLYEKPGDQSAFDLHYRDVHIPLVKALPGLRQYTISRNAVAAGGGEAFYLVAELDWDDMDALGAAFASPEGQAATADLALLAPGGGVRSMIFEVETL